jgi:hypothetical protein
MSSQLNLEQDEDGNWRTRAMLRSKELARSLVHKWLMPGGGGALEGVLTLSHKSG